MGCADTEKPGLRTRPGGPKAEQTAAQKEMLIQVDESQLEQQKGGILSEVYKVKWEGRTQFFKTEQIVKSVTEIEKDAIKRLPDSPFKQALMKREVELWEILQKKIRIEQTTGSGQAAGETLTEQEKNARSPFLFFLEIWLDLEEGQEGKARVPKVLASPQNRERAFSVLRTVTIPRFFGEDFAGEADEPFCESCMDFFRLTIPDYTAYQKFTSESGFQLGESITNHNIAASRLADLLGVGDIVARSQPAQLKVGDAAPKKGIVMEAAQGANYDLFREKKMKVDAMSPEFIRQLVCLEILDRLMAQTDRHVNNYFIQYDDRRRAVGVTGIDNDNAFGTLEKAASGGNHKKENRRVPRGKAEQRGSLREKNQKETERARRRLDYLQKRGWNIAGDSGKAMARPQAGTSAIDKNLAQGILALTPATLENALSDVLTAESLKALAGRVILMQQEILKSEEAARQRREKYLLDPEDWNQKTFDKLTADMMFGPESRYLEKVISAYHVRWVQ